MWNVEQLECWNGVESIVQSEIQLMINAVPKIGVFFDSTLEECAERLADRTPAVESCTMDTDKVNNNKCLVWDSVFFNN